MRVSTLLGLLAVTLLLPAASAQTDKTSAGAAVLPSSSRLAPDNDNFADATVVTEAGEYLSSTIDATSEVGEATAACVGPTDDSNQSVWFVFASADGSPVILDTDGSAVAPPGVPGQFTDTIMSLYTGSSLSTLVSIACNDDDPTNTLPGDFTSQILTPALTAGTTYYVRVSSFPALRINGEVRLLIDGEVTAPVSSEIGADALGSRLSVAPNPLQSAARASLVVGVSQDVSVSVYDALGRQVATLFDGAAVAGQTLDLRLDAAALPTGIYVVRALGTSLDLVQRVTVAR